MVRLGPRWGAVLGERGRAILDGLVPMYVQGYGPVAPQVPVRPVPASSESAGDRRGHSCGARLRCGSRETRSVVSRALVVLPEAREEFERAALWYADIRPSLGAAFVDQVAAVTFQTTTRLLGAAVSCGHLAAEGGVRGSHTVAGQSVSIARVRLRFSSSSATSTSACHVDDGFP